MENEVEKLMREALEGAARMTALVNALRAPADNEVGGDRQRMKHGGLIALGGVYDGK